MNIDLMQKEAQKIIKDLCQLPAPSHFEEKRAAYCEKWFRENGFTVHIDKALNVIAALHVTEDNPISIVMAHTDTVFPDTEPMPFREENGFFYSPGVCDDTSNLAVTMVCAKEFKNLYDPKDGSGLLFIANAAEEGLGNLKGCREIVKTYGKRIREIVSIDSASMHNMVTKAVGSHRYKVSCRTEGGHSFNAFGNRNAIQCLAALINALYTVKVPTNGNSNTTYNVGTITGGTSVNTIAQNAEMLYEYRSDDKECLAKMQEIFTKMVEAFRATGIELNVEVLGERPCMGDIDEKAFAALKARAVGALKDTLGLDMVERSGSTDCNIPLSCGIPSICFGVVRGAKCHTREESVEIASLADGCKLLMEFLKRSY